MLIGLTYDLRSVYLKEGFSEEETAEFDRDDTIDSIENALQALGHRTVRIGHARELMARLVKRERWDLVFNICEGLRGSARESQVPCILDVYGIPYTFSDAGVTALSLNKDWTKAIVDAAGIPAPAGAVVARIEDADRVELEYPLFTKPLYEGTGKGIGPASIVHNRAELVAQCRALLASFHQPVLVERYLPGREFTVSLVGTGDRARVLGTFEIVLRESAEPMVYGYINKEECEERVEYRLVSSANDPEVARAEQHALDAWRALDCRDAGRVDLRSDATGEPCFMEVNPLAGLHPLHSDLPMLATAIGMPYVDLIREIIESASERVVLQGTARIA